MRRLLILALAGATGCETAEQAAWRARVGSLHQQHAELRSLAHDPTLQAQAREVAAGLAALRAELDLAAFVRDGGVVATVYADDGAMAVARRGRVVDCEATLAALAPRRWLLSRWRLRLQLGGCDWFAQTGPAHGELLALLDAPPRPAWARPPPSWFSLGVTELERQARELEARTVALERDVGPLAVALALRRPLEEGQRRVASLKAQPAPCDLAIVRRELALDAEARGQLLEVEDARLVHPLEPRSDLRLRGLVQRADDGGLAWRCEAP